MGDRSASDMEALCSAIDDNKFFSALNRNVRLEVCRVMTYLYLRPNQILFRQGDVGDAFYLILSGRVGVYTEEKTEKEIENAADGGDPSEAPENDGSKRPDQNGLQKAVEQDIPENAAEDSKPDDPVTTGEDSASKNRDDTVSSTEENTGASETASEKKVKQVPKEEPCYVKKIDGAEVVHLLSLGPKDSFGEWALARDERRSATIVSENEACEFLRVDKHFYQRVLRNARKQEVTKSAADLTIRTIEPEKRTRTNLLVIKDYLQTMPTFKDLDEDSLFNVALELRWKNVAHLECLIRGGADADAMYIVMRGSLGVYRTVADLKQMSSRGIRKDLEDGRDTASSVNNDSAPYEMGLYSDDQEDPLSELWQMITQVGDDFSVGEWGLAREGRRLGSVVALKKTMVLVIDKVTYCRFVMQRRSRICRNEALCEIVRTRNSKERDYLEIELIDSLLKTLPVFDVLEPELRRHLCKYVTYKKLDRHALLQRKDTLLQQFMYVASGAIGFYSEEVQAPKRDLWKLAARKLLSVLAFTSLVRKEDINDHRPYNLPLHAESTEKTFGTLTKTLSAGGCLGEWSLIQNERLPFNLVSNTVAEIILLKKQQYQKILTNKQKFARQFRLNQNAINIVKNKTSSERSREDIVELDRLINTHENFKTMPFVARADICRVMQYVLLDAYRPLFQQGDPADSFYIILSGQVGVYVRKNASNNIKRTDGSPHQAKDLSPGQKQALQGNPSDGNSAQDPTKKQSAPGAVEKKIGENKSMGKEPGEKKEAQDTDQNNEIIRDKKVKLEEKSIPNAEPTFKNAIDGKKTLQTEDNAREENGETKKSTAVESGVNEDDTVGIYEEARVAVLTRGKIFGEWALESTSKARSATIRSLEETELVRIGRETYDKIVKCYQSDNLKRERAVDTLKSTDSGTRSDDDINRLLELLRGNKFFDNFDLNIKREICQCMVFRAFNASHAIFNQGDIADNFYFILRGTVGVYITIPGMDNVGKPSKSITSGSSPGRVRSGAPERKKEGEKFLADEAPEVLASRVVELRESLASNSEQVQRVACNPLNASLEERLKLFEVQMELQDAKDSLRAKNSFENVYLDRAGDFPVDILNNERAGCFDERLVLEERADILVQINDEVSVSSKEFGGNESAGRVVRINDSSYDAKKDADTPNKHKSNVDPNLMCVAELMEGDSFGENGLLENLRRNATIKTHMNSQFLIIFKEDFHKVFAGELKRQKLSKSIFIAKWVPFLTNTPSPSSIIYSPAKGARPALLSEKVAYAFKEMESFKGHTIIKSHTSSDHLYLVKSGTCKVIYRGAMIKSGGNEGGISFSLLKKSIPISSLGEGQMFGLSCVVQGGEEMCDIVVSSLQASFYYVSRSDIHNRLTKRVIFGLKQLHTVQSHFRQTRINVILEAFAKADKRRRAIFKEAQDVYVDEILGKGDRNRRVGGKKQNDFFLADSILVETSKLFPPLLASYDCVLSERSYILEDGPVDTTNRTSAPRISNTITSPKTSRSPKNLSKYSPKKSNTQFSNAKNETVPLVTKFSKLHHLQISACPKEGRRLDGASPNYLFDTFKKYMSPAMIEKSQPTYICRDAVDPGDPTPPIGDQKDAVTKTFMQSLSVLESVQASSLKRAELFSAEKDEKIKNTEEGSDTKNSDLYTLPLEGNRRMPNTARQRPNRPAAPKNCIQTSDASQDTQIIQNPANSATTGNPQNPAYQSSQLFSIMPTSSSNEKHITYPPPSQELLMKQLRNNPNASRYSQHI